MNKMDFLIAKTKGTTLMQDRPFNNVYIPAGELVELVGQKLESGFIVVRYNGQCCVVKFDDLEVLHG